MLCYIKSLQIKSNNKLSVLGWESYCLVIAYFKTPNFDNILD